MYTTKETLLKDYALSVWLSCYDGNPIEVYDALTECQNEEEWGTILEKYQIDIWEFVQNWYWESLQEQITSSYHSAIRLNKELNEATA